jgi:hypothetical protein
MHHAALHTTPHSVDSAALRCAWPLQVGGSDTDAKEKTCEMALQGRDRLAKQRVWAQALPRAYTSSNQINFLEQVLTGPGSHRTRVSSCAQTMVSVPS